MAYYEAVLRVEFKRCAECGKEFELTSRHERLYCSTTCAHRATARDWAKRNRATK